MKIISCVPSLTELLVDLGLKQEIVGVTKFCIHPKGFIQETSMIGGTKNLKTNRIQEIQPDLIIANKEENTKEDIELLQKHFKVYVSDINTFQDALESIEEISRLTNTIEKGNKLISDIKDNWLDIQNIFKNKSVIYSIWKEPFYSAGTQNYIHDVMQILGLNNLSIKPRYPEFKREEIKKLKPNYIFLSTEPYPFKAKDVEEFQEQYPNSKVTLVDGEMFSWYGSRMLLAASYFKHLAKELNL